MYSEFLNAQLWVEGSLFFSLFLCDLCLPFLLTTKGQKSFYWWWWCYFEVLCTVWEMKQKQNLVLIPILWSTFFFYCMCFCMERVTVEEEEEGGGSDVAIATIGLDSIIMLLMWFLLLAMPLVLLLIQLWLLLMLSGTVRLKAWIFLSFFVAVDGVEDGSNNDLVCVVWKQKFFKINA